MQTRRSNRVDGMVHHIRKTSETIILLLVVVSPWAFGCVHPFFRYCLTAGISLLLALWATELIVAPRRNFFTRFQIPLLVLAGILCIQVIPLGSFADALSPTSAEWKESLLPSQPEVIAQNDEPSVLDVAPTVVSAHGRISLYPAETMRRLLWLMLMGLVFTRCQDLASVESLKRLCYACLLNGSVLAYFSVIQHFTSEPGTIYWTFPSMGAAFGPFVNRNHFAFYINICFGLSIGLIGARQMRHSTRFRIEDLIAIAQDTVSLWMISVLVFMLGAVILCSSRGGLISLSGSLLITAAFVGATGSFQQGWKWFLLAAAIFAVAAGVQVWLGFEFSESRYADHTDNRTELWKPLLTLVRQFPVTGSGVGTLPHVEPTTRLPGTRGDYYLEYAHNEYLQLAIETGLLGLASGIVLIVMLASKIGRRIRESRHNAWMYVGLLFSLTCIALHSFTEFGLAIPAIAFLSAVVLGHLAGVGRVKPPKTDSMLARSILRAFALLLLGCAAMAFHDAKQFDLGERSLLAAQRAHNEKRWNDELEHYRQAVLDTPNDVEFLLQLARLNLDERMKFSEIERPGSTLEIEPQESQQIPHSGSQSTSPETEPRFIKNASAREAFQALLRVRELCPMATDTYFLLGRYQHLLPQSDSDLDYFQRAIQTRPVDSTLRFITGVAHLKRKNHDKALTHLRASLAQDTRHLREILELTITAPDLVTGGLLESQNGEVLVHAAEWYDQREADAETDESKQSHAKVALQLRRQALSTPQLQRSQTAELSRMKAVTLLRVGDVEEGIEAYEWALRRSPSKTAWRLELARIYGDLKKYENAHRHLKQLLSQKPGYTSAIRLRDRLLKQEARGE